MSENMRLLLAKQTGTFFWAPRVSLSIVEIRNDKEKDRLEEYYRHMDCDCIDLVCVEIDGHDYDIICDDEALLKGNPVPTLYISEDQVLFGSVPQERIITYKARNYRTCNLTPRTAKG